MIGGGGGGGGAWSMAKHRAEAQHHEATLRFPGAGQGGGGAGGQGLQPFGELSSLLTVNTLTGMTTDVYPRENCIAPAIVYS